MKDWGTRLDIRKTARTLCEDPQYVPRTSGLRLRLDFEEEYEDEEENRSYKAKHQKLDRGNSY